MMNRLMRRAERAPDPPASPPPAAVGMAAFPIVVNPGDAEQVRFAAYRADAIARDHEQRRAEGRARHPEFDRMRGEAMMYAHMLVQAGKWGAAEVALLEERLRG